MRRCAIGRKSSMLTTRGDATERAALVISGTPQFVDVAILPCQAFGAQEYHTGLGPRPAFVRLS
jgi:hypothetical protein